MCDNCIYANYRLARRLEMKHIKTLFKGKACVTMVGLFDMVEKKSKDVSRDISKGKDKKGAYIESN